MLCRLDDLDRRIVADFGRIIRRQRHLGKTERAIVLLIRRSHDLERGQHGVGVVERLVSVAHVDVDKSEGVAREPAGLDGNSAALQGPFGAVLGHGHAAAWTKFKLAMVPT